MLGVRGGRVFTAPFRPALHRVQACVQCALTHDSARAQHAEGRPLRPDRPAPEGGPERAAEDDHRSVTSLLEKITHDYLRAQGYLEERPRAARRRKAEVAPA